MTLFVRKYWDIRFFVRCEVGFSMTTQCKAIIDGLEGRWIPTHSLFKHKIPLKNSVCITIFPYSLNLSINRFYELLLLKFNYFFFE